MARKKGRLVAVTLACLLPFGAVPAGASLACSFGHPFVPVPVQWPFVGASFRDVVGVSSTDAWAVGQVAPGGRPRPFVSHLTGSTFRTVSTPVGNREGSLEAVSKVGSFPMAVGYLIDGNGHKDVLAIQQRRDGWHVLDTSSGALPGTGALSGLDSRSSREVWAVGWTKRSGVRIPLVLRWNGSRWWRIAVPVDHGELTAVDVQGNGDVWAVGIGGTPMTSPLVLHRDDTGWHDATPPIPPNTIWERLNGVAARSTEDVWVVGQVADDVGVRTVASHLEGDTWTTIAGPDPSPDSMIYTDVATGAGAHLVAVGYTPTSSDWGAVVQHGLSSDLSWSSIFPGDEPNVVVEGVAFVAGTETAFVVANNNSAQGQPLVYRNCTM
jgi:hypothetical protein